MSQAALKADRTAGLSPAELYGLYDDLLQEVVDQVSLVEDAEVDLVSLRRALAGCFSAMKACVTTLVGHGHQPLFEKLAELGTYVTDLIENCYHEGAQCVLVEELSFHFTLTGEQLSLVSGILPTETRHRLFEQILSSSLDPAADAGEFWADSPDESGLRALMSTFAVLGPPGDLRGAMALARLVGLISDEMLQKHRDLLPAVIEQFAANMAVIKPMFERMVFIGEQAKANPEMEEFSLRYTRMLALPAECLAALWEETRQPWVKQLFELTAEHPLGYLPFTWYQALGRQVDNAWHHRVQAEAAGDYLLYVIEHGVLVQGFSVADDHPHLTTLSAQSLKHLVGLIKRAGAGPETQVKAQKVVDQIIMKADLGFKLPMIDYMMNALQPVYFAKHNQILGKKFIKELGV